MPISNPVLDMYNLYQQGANQVKQEQRAQQEEQRQQQAMEFKIEKMNREEMEFINQQENLKLDQADAQEIYDLVSSDASDAEVLQKTYFVKMRAATRSEDPLAAIQQAQEEYASAKQDLEKVGAERQNMRKRIEELNLLVAEEKAEQAKLKTKSMSEGEAEKKTAEQRNIEYEAEARGITPKEVIEGKKKQKPYVPTEQEMNTINTLLESQDLEGGYSDMDEGEAEMLKGDIAFRANQLRQENPNLSQPQSAMLAIQELKKNKSIGYDDGGFFGGDRPTYAPQVSQPQQAPAKGSQQSLPTPKSEAEYNAIPAGQAYIDSQGRKRIKQ